LLDSESIENIEANSRFVEDQDRRIVRYRACDGYLLLHARRQFLDSSIGILLQTEPMDQVFNAFGYALRGVVVDSRKKFNGCASSQPGVQSRRRRIEPEVFANPFGIVNDIVAHDGRGTRRRRKNRGEHAQSCRLSCAVGSEKSENFAFVTFKADRIHRFDLAASLIVKSLREIADHNRRAHLPSNHSFANLPKLPLYVPIAKSSCWMIRTAIRTATMIETHSTARVTPIDRQ